MKKQPELKCIFHDPNTPEEIEEFLRKLMVKRLIEKFEMTSEKETLSFLDHERIT
jgi:hypothetical protein